MWEGHFLAVGWGTKQEVMNWRLEEQGECLGREEKDNPGRKNRQVVTDSGNEGACAWKK